MHSINNSTNTENSVSQEGSVEKPKKKFKWKKFLGFFFLGLIVLGIGYLGYRFYAFKPYRVIVSNVTSRSATISWVTEGAEPGEVLVKEGGVSLPIRVGTSGMVVGYDDRDYSNAELQTAEKTQENISESGDITGDDIETEVVVTELGRYWSHHVTVRNLDPETEYEFLVGDGLVFEKVKTVDTEINEISTLVEPENIETPIPAYGIVRYYDGEKYLPPIDTLVYCTLYDEASLVRSNAISSVTSETGGWYFDLTNAYTPDGKEFIKSGTEENDIILELTIENEWLGRWSKDIFIKESAPASPIELYDIDEADYINEDVKLEYEGISYEDDNTDLSFVQKASAMRMTDPEEEPGQKNTTTKITSEKVTAKTKISESTKKSNKEIQVSLADAARAAAYEAQAADYFQKEAINTENTDKERIAAAQKAQQAKERSQRVIEMVEHSKDDKVETTALTELVKEVKEQELTDEEVRESMTGNCVDGTCKPDGKEELQCGWYTEEKCICACEFSTGVRSISISAGDSCSCDWVSGNVVVTDGEIGKIEEYGDYLEGGYRCILGETQGYWVRKDYDVNIGSLVSSDITNKEDCLAMDKIEYLVGVEEKEPREDKSSTYLVDESVLELLDSVNCEDSITHNLVLIESGTDKYLDCKANHLFGEKSYKEITCIDNSTSLGGYCCDEMNKNYSQIEGVYAQCLQNRWVEVTEEDIQEKITAKYINIGLGDNCNTSLYDYCQCKYSVSDENGSTEGDYKITKGSASTVCGIEFNGIETKGSTRLEPSLVHAEETATSTYLVDTESSMVKDLKPGEYSYEYDGDLYLFEVTEYEYAQTGGEFSLYIDVDRNGEVDGSDINLTDSATTIELEVLEQGYMYSLREGFNFVSFPFIFTNEDIKTASDLLTHLNETYNNSFYSISKYDSGKWVIVGANGGTYDQNDFQLIPGQGYVLKTKWDLNITLYGNEVTYEASTDSAPIRFMPGWNLVGLYGTNVKSYTAESILKDITNYEPIDFTAVNVSRWEESRALYEALQRDTDSTVYGLDFPIELKRSYFIKVTDGEGNWEPGIK